MSSLHKVFQLETEANTLVVIPQGDTTKFRYSDIQSELNRLLGVLNSPVITNVVVDFGSVTLVGTIVIDSLVRMLRRRSNRSGGAAMCNASEAMRDVLNDMNLNKVWPYFATREEAIASFQQDSSASANDG